MASPLRTRKRAADVPAESPDVKRQLSASLAALRLSTNSGAGVRHVAVRGQRPSPFGGERHLHALSPFLSNSAGPISGAHAPAHNETAPSPWAVDTASTPHGSQNTAALHAHATQRGTAPTSLDMTASFSASLDDFTDDMDDSVQDIDTEPSESGLNHDKAAGPYGSRALVLYKPPPTVRPLRRLTQRPIFTTSSPRSSYDAFDDNWYNWQDDNVIKRGLAVVPYNDRRKRLFLDRPPDFLDEPQSAPRVVHAGWKTMPNVPKPARSIEDIMEL